VVHLRGWLAYDLFPGADEQDVVKIGGLFVGVGQVRRQWGPAVYVSWYWVKVRMRAHGEPGESVVVALWSLVRKDFIDGATG
jgi:hypothetical protein